MQEKHDQNRAGEPFPREFIVPQEYLGSRLDAFVAATLPECGSREAKRLTAQGLVTVNGKERAAHYKLAQGMNVCVMLPVRPEFSPDIPLIAATSSYAAFVKPAGLHTASIAAGFGSNLEDILRDRWKTQYASKPFTPSETVRHFGQAAVVINAIKTLEASFPASSLPPSADTLPLSPPVPLSRLDRATSGIVPAAFTPVAANAFRKAEKTGNIRKYYLAVVHGSPTGMVIDNALDTDSRTKSRVLPRANTEATRHTEMFPLAEASFLLSDSPSPLTLVVVRIQRGARHQIRAHLAHVGFPILGDDQYGQNDGATALHLHHAQLVAPDFTAFSLPAWLP